MHDKMLHAAALTLLDSGLYVSVQFLARSLLPLVVRNPAPHSALSLHYDTNVFYYTHTTNTMPGNYELFCLENPLLDIQGVG